MISNFQYRYNLDFIFTVMNTDFYLLYNFSYFFLKFILKIQLSKIIYILYSNSNNKANTSISTLKP